MKSIYLLASRHTTHLYAKKLLKKQKIRFCASSQRVGLRLQKISQNRILPAKQTTSIRFLPAIAITIFNLYKNNCKKKSINVYIPHPKNPFTNFITYTQVNSINIYEDGIMNYYDVNSSNYEIKDLNIKIMKLCKLKYKDYQGHLTGLEFLKINKYYLSRPEFAVLSNKAQKKVCLYVLKIKNY